MYRLQLEYSRTRTGVCVLQGGSIIRLFHKELEAFLVAEGLFNDEISEDGQGHIFRY